MEKSTATAKVTITRKALDDTLSLFDTNIEAYMAGLAELAETDQEAAIGMASEEQLKEAMGVLYMEALDKTPLSTASIEVEYVKEGNMWNPTEASSDQMFETLFG
ncbi:MAG: hypothetical protein FWG03_00260 [Clostridiales bacterium]|nr:hypothetical protein [Clostridiales bacterium]